MNRFVHFFPIRYALEAPLLPLRLFRPRVRGQKMRTERRAAWHRLRYHAVLSLVRQAGLTYSHSSIETMEMVDTSSGWVLRYKRPSQEVLLFFFYPFSTNFRFLQFVTVTSQEEDVLQEFNKTSPEFNEPIFSGMDEDQHSDFAHAFADEELLPTSMKTEENENAESRAGLDEAVASVIASSAQRPITRQEEAVSYSLYALLPLAV